MIAAVPPLAVALPLSMAGLLLVLSHVLPRYVPDVLAIATSLCVYLIGVEMAPGAVLHPLVYWFGGWSTEGAQVVGIRFFVGQAGAGMAGLIGLLFAATLVFAWGYYEEVHAHFHLLMMLFMAGMVGFCLTHVLFNMFVWFEVMSVAAFAVTGYALRSPAITGALNFTVVNTIGSYLILGGIGLLYGQAGALDFQALGQVVARSPSDPVIGAAFALLSMGLLIKAAQVPFQSWLADAHAVAPSPASVIFSGAMVAIGVFGIARLVFDVFAAAPAVMGVVRSLLLLLGAVSVVLGGAMCVIQRHITRLLAFSTIAHTGILLIGLALLNPHGVQGMLAYLAGHGLVKGSLFMVAGIIEALCGGIDEIGLRGAGRRIWPAGIVMAAGALLLAGLPVGVMDNGIGHIEAGEGSGRGWVEAAVLFGAGCTGGAVLRVVGRVFLGLGRVPGEERRAPTDDEREKADRPLWLMLVPAALLLLLLAATMGGFADGFGTGAAAVMMQPGAAATSVPLNAPFSPWPWSEVAPASWTVSGLG